MADDDEAEQAARRLEDALERIAAHQSRRPPPGPNPGPATDPRVAAKLDTLIRTLRSALDQ